MDFVCQTPLKMSTVCCWSRGVEENDISQQVVNHKGQTLLQGEDWGYPLCEKWFSAGHCGSITVCKQNSFFSPHSHWLTRHFITHTHTHTLTDSSWFLCFFIHATSTVHTVVNEFACIVWNDKCICSIRTLSSVPGQRCMWFPMRQHPGHWVPHLDLGSHVEVGIMSKLEGQHVSGVINQNVFPYITGFGKISTRNKSHC